MLSKKENQGGENMPVHKVNGGYRYGKTGKVYKSKAKAEKQGRAIKANQRKGGG